jgi:two-component system response regulator HupR/HoxA
MPEDVKSRRVCLLIVDDEPLNRELLRRVLYRDYEIEEAEDALHAIQVLERRDGDIELVLCDQLMPGRSGTQLAVEIRERWPDMHFILLTGYDDDPVVVAALERGDVAEVVPKPWRGQSLKECITRQLGGVAAQPE